MPALEVNLFGQFRVQSTGQVLNRFSAHKVQELFAFLLLHRDQGHSRETLVNLLWGHQHKDDAQLKRCLRQTLWQLQVALRSQSESMQKLLLIGPDRIQLHSDTSLWLDVATFEQAALLVQGIPGEALEPSGLQALQSAVNLYRGELLDGWYQDWCLYNRERLQGTHLAMLDKLLTYQAAHHEYESALAYGARILQYDQAHERTHRRLMILHYLTGDRTAAIRQFGHCVNALTQELDVAPSPQTVALYEQIRANSLVDAALLASESQVKPDASGSLVKGVLQRLEHLQTVLATAQAQIQQDIQTIRQAGHAKC